MKWSEKMANYQALYTNLRQLKLDRFAEHLGYLLDHQDEAPKSLSDALFELTTAELKYREQKKINLRIKLARFPYEKTLADFDFSYQPGINQGIIEDLGSLRFTQENQNVLFIGTSGVGKTHLATAIGIEGCKQGISTQFIRCSDLINKLQTAQVQGRSEEVLRRYARFQILIIDEIGYLPIESVGAKLFFQLIERRYERKSTIITTNIPLSKWGNTFSDKMLANAILDRLVHHAKVIRITGRSYRMKDHLIEKKDNSGPDLSGFNAQNKERSSETL
ncbi:MULTISPECIES: IS21-like element helper ATPase IstB [Lactobacillaceae]|jgi:DNA replication protein DnaC|nr:IS21-like element helper ATPase IstB [Lactiplantibacillus pentosus]MDT6989846.1 IS21-like element helper ATPase IstB [Lactiplantibacillus pentosus]MDT6990973.1 IS21-like element helper ATPase IstB [Lactiplantibacillus pentosus]MDT6991443.1 IS21-like element helper ATPase IstB [Lactiplantibacillus pentosus]MDT6991799.1 IS21-like element helper ATPase IstB [Lactiplantibacillus pentosus]MDT7038778.1 IS21-like element helper ATPase IstB [Lactiplantibacillus pentosus]